MAVVDVGTFGSLAVALQDGRLVCVGVFAGPRAESIVEFAQHPRPAGIEAAEYRERKRKAGRRSGELRREAALAKSRALFEAITMYSPRRNERGGRWGRR